VDTCQDRNIAATDVSHHFRDIFYRNFMEFLFGKQRGKRIANCFLFSEHACAPYSRLSVYPFSPSYTHLFEKLLFK